MTNYMLSEYKNELLLAGVTEETVQKYIGYTKKFLADQIEEVTADNVLDLLEEWLVTQPLSTHFKRTSVRNYARIVFGVDPEQAEKLANVTRLMNVMDAMRDLAPKWMDKGACKGEDTRRIFFLDKNIPKAKAICEGCNVKSECLNFALDNQEWGVWGGTTRAERAAMRRVIKAE